MVLIRLCVHLLFWPSSLYYLFVKFMYLPWHGSLLILYHLPLCDYSIPVLLFYFQKMRSCSDVWHGATLSCYPIIDLVSRVQATKLIAKATLKFKVMNWNLYALVDFKIKVVSSNHWSDLYSSIFMQNSMWIGDSATTKLATSSNVQPTGISNYLNDHRFDQFVG